MILTWQNEGSEEQTIALQCSNCGICFGWSIGVNQRGRQVFEQGLFREGCYSAPPTGHLHLKNKTGVVPSDGVPVHVFELCLSLPPSLFCVSLQPLYSSVENTNWWDKHASKQCIISPFIWLKVFQNYFHKSCIYTYIPIYIYIYIYMAVTYIYMGNIIIYIKMPRDIYIYMAVTYITVEIYIHIYGSYIYNCRDIYIHIYGSYIYNCRDIYTYIWQLHI